MMSTARWSASGSHLRRLRARLALVDELDAALEVEAEHGLLGLDGAGDPGDHDQRAENQPDDQEQDEPIALTIGHRLCWMLEVRDRGVAVVGSALTDGWLA